MKVSFVSGKPAGSGIAVIPVFEGNKAFGSAKAYIKGAKVRYDAAQKAAKFKGQAGQSFDIYAPPGSKAARLHVVGAGKKDKFNAEMFAAKITAKLLFAGQSGITFHLDGFNLSPDDAARAAVGARLAGYRFNNHKTKLAKEKYPNISTIRVSHESPAQARKAYDNFHGPVCDGVIFARDLVNEPANIVYPKAYADRVKALKDIGLKIEVLGEKKMEALGMYSLLGVGRGSERESQMVVMRWNGGKKGAKPAAIIGKGVTFDTGGISLKPGAGMWDMKGDMGGSAAVVGAMIGVAKRKAKANVIGVIGLVENMPDGRAQNPGDIVVSMSGQTIEVLNTDAEGRLVLADALHYTHTKYKPAAMINLATLTGAIIVSLGHEHAGVFSNDDGLAEQISSASASSGERSWRLPLLPEYDKLLDTPNADMKNNRLWCPFAESLDCGKL